MKWTRDNDMILVSSIFNGRTVDGVSKETGWLRGQISNRLTTLRLSFAGGRKAERIGMTPEQYLDTSPIYSKTVNPLQPDLLPSEETQDYYCVVADHLEYAAKMFRVMATRKEEIAAWKSSPV